MAGDLAGNLTGNTAGNVTGEGREHGRHGPAGEPAPPPEPGREHAPGHERVHEHGHEHRPGPGHEPGHEHAHAEASPAAPRDPRDEELEAFVRRVAGELAEQDPAAIARRAGVAYDPEARHYAIRVYGKLFAARHPSLEVHELAADHHTGALWLRVLLAHYFRTADGAPLAGRWVSLRELPGGLIYERAFQGYSGDELARHFGPDLGRLRELAAQHGARPMAVGDVAFSLDVLPRVPIAVVCYQGDDELPSTAKLLFDAAATHYLPTDALATLGGRLTRLLLQAAGLASPRQRPITPGWLGRER